MTVSEFISLHNAARPGSTYFATAEMKMFGDTIGNYTIIEHAACYELARKKPVKYGLRTSHFFDKDTFQKAQESCTQQPKEPT